MSLVTRGFNMPVDLNILVGGEAGQGIQTIGFILGKTLVRGGLHVFADQDYESRIRGGHNFFRIRVSDQEVKAQTENLDILIALDRATIDLHRGELKENGVIILDHTALKIESPASSWLDVPLEKLAQESAVGKLMVNSVAVGAALGLIGLDFTLLADVLNWHFARHEVKVREDNIKAARVGYDFTVQKYNRNLNSQFFPLPQGPRLFLTGHESVSLGAIAAGCRFVAAYPMTPTTPILEYLADKGRHYGIAVIQPEDEISAINMAIGAGYAGVRALTATSGSGFALMVEGIGLAGITETPVVIVLGERPGPAIGLPTRTEQGELLFALRTGTGEFPRVVFAPSGVEDAFYLTVRAFNLAEKYQIPVIILTDTHLGNSYSDIQRFDLDRVKIDRGDLLTDEAAAQLVDYQRYRETDSGISPRALPLQSRALVVADADEHDETGHLIESAAIRTRQVAKRLRKYAGLEKEISPPFRGQTVGAGLTLIGWGSTLGAIREAAAILGQNGVSCNILHFTELWPFPVADTLAALRLTKRNFVVESNATGQLAWLIRAETGIEVTGRINKWDGRPISARYILDRLKTEGI
jgi:2-oxoglutarate/2-oxoacid ferredoxin oxidoreductase subunit alpha